MIPEKPILYPLTHAQQGIMTELLQSPGCMHYNLPIKIDLPLEVDVTRLINAIDCVINAHPNWKTRFIQQGGRISQYCQEDRIFKTQYLKMDDSELDTHISDFIRPFDPFGNELLVRFEVIRTEKRILVLLDALHTVTDGLTYVNVINEVSQVYNGGTPTVEKKSIFEQALSHQEYDSSEHHKLLTEFYKEKYNGTEIKTIASAKKNVEGKTIEQKVVLDRTMVDKCCTEGSIRLAALLNAAYCLLLSAYTRSGRVAYTTLLHGRDRKTKDTHGTFICTLPLMADVDPNLSVREFVERVGTEFMGGMRRLDYSFADFVKNTGFMPETIFAYQGPKIRNTLSLGSISSDAEQLRIAANTNAPLGIVVYDLEDGLEICAECSEARFSKEYIETFARSYGGILSNMVKNLDAPISSIGIFSKEQEQALIAEATQQDAPACEYKTVLEAIWAQAEKTPQSIAVKSESESYSYAELIDNAWKIASYLQGGAFGSVQSGAGCGSQKSIPLETSREAHSIAAMLGIMLSGANYIPIDPQYPQDWKDFITSNCGASDILSDSTVQEILSGKLSLDKSDKLSPAQGGRGIITEGISPEPESIAYMIYTSGSTGNPKGVMISHRALWAFVQGMRHIVNLSSKDRISCHSSFSFDASIEDIYPILTVGGTLYVVPEKVRKDIAGIAQFLSDNSISGGNYTTRLGQILMDSCELPTLRYIVLGGEKMTHWPEKAQNIDTYNTYGPTEFTVDATWFKMQKGCDYDNIPIGKAFPGMCATIADHNGHLLPPGVAGEIILSGKQLASGYYGIPKLTARSFPESDIFPQKRYYRTGDVGLINSANQIEFLRRDDSQVKLFGYRIELEEIDRRVLQIEGIKQAKSIVRNNGTLLCCYFTGEPQVSEQSIKESLAKVLPPYMIPKIITRMDSLPLTAGGKLDVNSLPAPSEQSTGKQRVLPENDSEVLMLNLVCKILGRDDIDVTDDLISQGMSSLQIMELVVKSFEAGLEININEAYGCKSIRELLSIAPQKTSPYWTERQDGKPTAIVVSGVTGLRRLENLIRHLSIKYSVYVITPVANDITPAANGTTANDLVKDYLQGYLNTESQMPALVCGHSFGGELALMLAKEIAAESGISPEVVLYDTSHHFEHLDKLDASILKTLPQRLQTYLALHSKEHNCNYSGKITLHSARLRDVEYRKFSPLLAKEMSASLNEKRWRKAHKDIAIIPADCGHEDII